MQLCTTHFGASVRAICITIDAHAHEWHPFYGTWPFKSASKNEYQSYTYLFCIYSIVSCNYACSTMLHGHYTERIIKIHQQVRKWRALRGTVQRPLSESHQVSRINVLNLMT